MLLNTNSEVRIALGGRQGTITLVRGEALFDVVPNPQRPLAVVVRDTRVAARGGSFAVRLRQDPLVEIGVLNGTLAIDRTAKVWVAAGTIAVVGDGTLSVQLDQMRRIERQLAWREGRVQFAGTPLGEAVAEFNRYTVRQLVLSRPQDAGIAIGGSFRATDPESFADAVSRVFHVHIRVIDGPDAARSLGATREAGIAVR
jgi:transmembrane sensor